MGGGGRGGEWYLEKRGSRKPLAPSRNPGSVFDKSEVSLYLSFFFFVGGVGGVGLLGASECRLFIPKDIGSLDWSFLVTFLNCFC